jgi:hypothetical protein
MADRHQENSDVEPFFLIERCGACILGLVEGGMSRSAGRIFTGELERLRSGLGRVVARAPFDVEISSLPAAGAQAAFAVQGNRLNRNGRS